MSLELLKVGHCFHPEAIVTRGASLRSQKFPAIVALLKHPTKGYMLFDTGYAKRFMSATQPFPQRLYRWCTPMHLCESENLHAQLHQRGIAAEDIRYIFISHFHADHIAGLKDFPAATFICSEEALSSIQRLGRFRGLIKGYLPSLLPEDICQRLVLIEQCKPCLLHTRFSPFKYAYDLFADGALLAVALPGHAYGHFGLLHIDQGTFLVGDACWTNQALTSASRPHPIAHLLLSDTKQYYQTIDKLSQLYKKNTDVSIVPAHCHDTYICHSATSYSNMGQGNLDQGNLDQGNSGLVTDDDV
ncbi:MBL fold metallo-hydrolase [Agaribacterium sp. ZY112]|uniref:MBL fold metallo-hydrolase n=1 Tax=Agaribacterium sp. ZY112 TaxID=3233574 RepID=UPI003525F124